MHTCSSSENTNIINSLVLYILAWQQATLKHAIFKETFFNNNSFTIQYKHFHKSSDRFKFRCQIAERCTMLLALCGTKFDLNNTQPEKAITFVIWLCSSEDTWPIMKSSFTPWGFLLQNCADFIITGICNLLVLMVISLPLNWRWLR